MVNGLVFHLSASVSFHAHEYQHLCRCKIVSSSQRELLYCSIRGGELGGGGRGCSSSPKFEGGGAEPPHFFTESSCSLGHHTA